MDKNGELCELNELSGLKLLTNYSNSRVNNSSNSPKIDLRSNS